MSEQSDNKRTAREKALDRLVALAGQQLPEPHNLPSREVVQAYALGEATEEQQGEVLRALEKSAAFRAELLEIMDDLESVTKVEAAEHMALQPSEARSGQMQEYIAQAPPPSLWKWLRSRVQFKLLVPAAIASTAVSLFFLRPAEDIPSWNVVPDPVDPGRLVSFELKGVDDADTLPQSYATSKDAALAAFRGALKLDGGRISVGYEYLRPSVSGSGRSLQLVLLGQQDSVLATYDVVLPQASISEPIYVQAWMLALPSLQLRWIEMTSDTLLVTRTQDFDGEGGITFAYQTDSGWVAVPPFVFGFPGATGTQ